MPWLNLRESMDLGACAFSCAQSDVVESPRSRGRFVAVRGADAPDRRDSAVGWAETGPPLGLRRCIACRPVQTTPRKRSFHNRSLREPYTTRFLCGLLAEHVRLVVNLIEAK
jgi:hypothetical protein